MAFASELKPLLALDWLPREVDRDSLYHFVKFSHVPGRRSILKSVRQVEPGEWLRFEDGPNGARLAGNGRFWDPLDHARMLGLPFERSENELLDELEALLAQAVKRQVVSDVPVGCFLSAGVDSSLLALLFAKSYPGALRTFTIGYREGEWNEAGPAQQLAQAIGAEHEERIVEPRQLLELIPRIPEFFDHPFADPSLLPTLVLCKMAREKVTVALSGDGGDELFFGYEQHHALLRLLNAGIDRVPRALRSAAMRPLGAVLGQLSHRAEKLSEILEFRDEAELMQYFIGTIGPLRLDRLAGLLAVPPTPGPAYLAPLIDELKGLGLPASARIEHVFLRTFMVDTVLAKSDRASMAYGLEARVPFLDNDLVDFAARVPLGLKLKGRTSKYLLRKLLERELGRTGKFNEAQTREITYRRKTGFGVPLREWWRTELRGLLDQYLDPDRLKSEGYFKPEPVQALVRGHCERGENHSHLLWSLVTFQMWRERYL